MTSSEQRRVLEFGRGEIDGWRDPKGNDWPVVYLISDSRYIYVGETTRAKNRLRQHFSNPGRSQLNQIRIVVDDEFNKSVCLDLESRLIAWLHADERFEPLNRNDGQQSSDYFEKHTRYKPAIDEIFEELRQAGIFSRSAPQIENLNLFKLSPFKSLNDEQLDAVDGILDSLFTDLESGHPSTNVVQGGPGTGKTIVAIYVLKLLRDIQAAPSDPDPEEEGRFSEFFLSRYRHALHGRRIGFVVPQQSLRRTVQNVFKRTPGLRNVEILSPYTVARSATRWDILVVDETHRLTHRGAGPTRGMFNERSRMLFGEDADSKTAVDWITAQSDHQIFMVDGAQSVRPADVPAEIIDGLIRRAEISDRLHRLESQMRVAAGGSYLDFARGLLSDAPTAPSMWGFYDLRFYNNLERMRNDILRLDSDPEVGLSRLVAGYAWKWESKGDPTDQAPYDIELDGVRLRWNRTDKDWIASEGSVFEVGSVHTVQGYDLNYAGVIIGPDIVWDEHQGGVRAVRNQHYDPEVRRALGDEALLEYIQNAYYVLLTRGIRGTFVYACDPALRERVRSAIRNTTGSTP